MRLSWVVMAAVFAVAGCQAEQSTTPLVAHLPPPNFDGPGDLSAAPTSALPPAAMSATPPRVSAPSAKSGFDVPPEWIPPIRPTAWRWIIIHHSATSVGSASQFDRMHKQKGWDELGYHFVVGNGTGTGDGQVEVGSRWKKQKWGAHAKTPDNKYNDFGIGICLVGNFDVTRPSWRQMESVAKLVAHLQRTYNVPADRVIGHGMVRTLDRSGTSTQCPGRNMNITQIRQLSTRILTDAGEAIPAAVEHANAAAANDSELIYDVPAGR